MGLRRDRPRTYWINILSEVTVTEKCKIRAIGTAKHVLPDISGMEKYG
jgi:hypothetical protein